MNHMHLTEKIGTLWPRIPDEHIDLICKIAGKFDLDTEQVNAALEAEWQRPANKVPPHERIITALRAALPKPFREVTARSDDPDQQFFRSVRAAGKWPAEWSNEQVVRGMACVVRDKARRVHGVTTTDIRVCETDFRRFTTLDPFEIDAALCEIYGDDGEVYLVNREDQRQKAIQRRATERDIVKRVPLNGDKHDRQERLIAQQELVHADAKHRAGIGGEVA